MKFLVFLFALAISCCGSEDLNYNAYSLCVEYEYANTLSNNVFPDDCNGDYDAILDRAYLVATQSCNREFETISDFEVESDCKHSISFYRAMIADQFYDCFHGVFVPCAECIGTGDSLDPFAECNGKTPWSQ